MNLSTLRARGVVVAARKFSGGVTLSIIQTGASRYTVTLDDSSKHSLQYRNQVQGVYNTLEKAEARLRDFIEVSKPTATLLEAGTMVQIMEKNEPTYLT